MKKTFIKISYIIFVFGIIECTIIPENKVTMVTFVYQDKEKYKNLLKLGRYLSVEEIFGTYVEIPIKEEYRENLLKIINASRLNIWTAFPFGPKYSMSEPDYSINIYYTNNKKDFATFWDGYYQFALRGWRIIQDNDRIKLYEILSSIKFDNIDND